MLRLKLMLGVSILFLVSGQANSTLITFEEVVDPTDINDLEIFDSPDEYLESQGFVFKATPSARRVYVQSAAFHAARSFSDNGTNTLGSYSTDGGVAMEIFSASLISLSSVDFAEYRGGDTSISGFSPLDSLLITGYFLDGRSISKTVELDLISDGPGGSDDFQTELFDSSWSGLTHLEVGSDDGPARNIFYLDNVEILSLSASNPFYDDLVSYQPPSPIPVPAAVWLFGTALVGLVGFGRRKKAA